MNYLFETLGIYFGWVVSVALIFGRYLIFAGGAYLFFYIFKKRHLIKRKIQKPFPERKQVMFEIYHSLSTAVVFAIMGMGIYLLKLAGCTKIYSDISTYGIGWVGISFFLLLIVHDTWFYWVHRIMHYPKLFRILHKVHHQSFNPTPWTAFSFHPTEAFLEIAFLPIIVCLMPVHPFIVLLFSIWSLSFNIIGHTGFEIMPKGFVNHPVFRWFNTPTHHNLHHQVSNCNYGLYFNFWDWIMGTNHVAYQEEFEKIHKL